MNLTDEELSLIEEYAGLFLTIGEIAIMLEKDVPKLIAASKNKTNPVYMAYMKGKIKMKVDIRRKVIKMAIHGSPKAEEQVNKYISDQELSETD